MRAIKKDPGKGKKVLQSIPIPGWLFSLVTVVYCEVLLHLWTMNDFSLGRFAAVVLFALGFGGLLGQIAGFIGHRTWGKWITAALAAVVSVFYIVEYFVNDAYQSFMPMRMLLGGAKGVTTDFGDVVVSLVLNDLWRILVMLLPALLFALLARPTETVWKTRWFLLAGAVAAYLLGFGVVRGVGTDAARFSSAYNFDSAVQVFGLNIAIPLDAINSGGSDGETPEFVVVDSAAAPAESSPETSSPAEETAPAETEAVVYGDNVMDIDFNALIANTGNSRINAVSQYVSSQTPSKKNEYTGMFAGKNLILITAEAFAKQVIDPERTPTLYRMATKGIQFTDYYQPAWGGSTTTGEFSNVIGLVPADVGMCMKQAVYQDLFLTMGHQLQKLDYYSAAYHNHFADFYDRNKTHTKLGYDRFLARYGGLEGITPVWPESDLEMIDISVPQYIDQQPFSIYYMTVSGHCGYSLKANAMYEGVYPLVSAISRPLISKHLVRAAHQFGADTISHGCTGKGNDQVRFEVSIASIDPTLKAISPIRDLSLTRDVEIAFAKEHKLPIVQTEKSPFSIDQNVWGRAIETGFLEDPWNGPTKDCYSYTDDPAFPPVEDEVVIEFKQGVPVKIDGHDVTPLQAIEEMNRRAGAQGIGRIDLIEDRLVGIKSRELYEAPGAVALITAHQELENCCLEREQHRIKRDIDKRWAELVYDAQWFSPATQSLNAFIEDTQKYVSGEIRMVLHGGRAVVTGRRSDSSLYDYNLATYDSGDSFDQKSSNGFIDIYGLPSRVAAARDVKFGNGIEVPENSVE